MDCQYHDDTAGNQNGEPDQRNAEEQISTVHPQSIAQRLRVDIVPEVIRWPRSSQHERATTTSTIGMRRPVGMYCEAKLGFGTMKKGEGEVITGWKNKMQAAIAHIAPADVTAEMHRKMAEPGSATKKGAA
jgi:hypothetical protein